MANKPAMLRTRPFTADPDPVEAMSEARPGEDRTRVGQASPRGGLDAARRL
jgi:hypothetical protein